MTKKKASDATGRSKTGIGRREFLKTAAAGGALVAGSFPLANVARADSNVIKIGVIDLITGPRGAFGEAGPWVEKKLEGLLKAGIKIGDKNYAIEPIIRDSQSDVNRTASIGNELVLKEKVDLVLINDGLAAPANEICDQNGMPAINFGIQPEPWHAARGSTMDKGFPWTFLFMWQTTDLFGNFIGLWNSAKTNRKVGTFYADMEAGQNFREVFADTLPKKGFTEVYGGMFRMETDDFSNQVTKWQKGDAQILTGLAFPPHMSTLFGQMGQAGYKPEMVTVAAAGLFASAVTSYGASGNGLTTEIWWSPRWGTASSLTHQTAQQLADDWEASTGKQWTQPLGYSHALWEVALRVLKDSGDPKDKEAVRHAIKGLTMETVVGKVDFKSSKYPSTALTELAGGQWLKNKTSKKFPYDLYCTYNGLAPRIKVEEELKLMSQLA
jgi:branched-chain amino acid transport system substrate-binding protein